MNNSVDITTNIGCRVQCKFCPQDVSMSNYATKNNFKKIDFGTPILMSYHTFIKILKKIPKNEIIRVISHLDADGISAASIMVKCLNNDNRKYSLSIVQQIKKEVLESLAREPYKYFIFKYNAIYIVPKRSKTFQKRSKNVPKRVILLNFF